MCSRCEIKTEVEYFIALYRIGLLMDALPGTNEEKNLDILCNLIIEYEDNHYEIDKPNIFARIMFRLDQMIPRKD